MRIPRWRLYLPMHIKLGLQVGVQVAVVSFIAMFGLGVLLLLLARFILGGYPTDGWYVLFVSSVVAGVLAGLIAGIVCAVAMKE